MELRDALVQPGVVLLQTDYLTVHPADGQFLVVDVTVTEGRAPYDDYTLRLDGTTHRPIPKDRTRRLWRVYGRGLYEPTQGGILVFDLPDQSAAPDGDAVLACPSWEHALPDATRTRLAQGRASFTVDATAPTPLEVGESPRVTLTVQNTADVPGRFLAALNRAGPMVAMRPADLISLPVAADAEREIVHEATDVTGHNVPEDYLGDGERDLRFYLNLVGGSREFDVAYQTKNE